MQYKNKQVVPSDIRNFYHFNTQVTECERENKLTLEECKERSKHENI